MPLQKNPLAVKTAGIFMIAAVFLGIWFALPREQAEKGTVARDATDLLPPPVVIVSGVCPFEGCRFGRWLLQVSIPAHQAPGGAAVRQLLPGQAVNAMSSEVRAVPHKAVITGTYSSDEEEGLRVGHIVYVLYPIGEGAVAVWNKGKVVNGSLDLKFRFEDKTVPHPLEWQWWVQIRLEDGALVWVRDPQGKFLGMDRLGPG